MSVANKIGRGLGTVGALAVEGVVRAAYFSGEFATEVATAAEEGFVEKRIELLDRREALIAEHKAKVEARKAAHQAKLAAPVVMKPEPVAEPVAEPVPVKRGRKVAVS
jgi:hypothetical protein